ncbi:MAG: tetratricopeptide repeat protein [Rhodobacterales bacterium]|nr:tetratricopeptide repeat protein [Rhodobacterales bacterium]
MKANSAPRSPEPRPLAAGRPAHRFAWRRTFRVLALLVLATVPGACVTPAAQQDPPSVADAPPTGTLSGNYLAGRQAQRNHDLGRAAEFVDAALKQDPENLQLLRRAFLLNLIEGRMDKAMVSARQLIERQPDNSHQAHILLGIDALRRGDYDTARRELADLPGTGVAGLLGPLLNAWVEAGAGNTDSALRALAALNHRDGLKTMHDMHAAALNDLGGRQAAAKDLYAGLAANQGGHSLRVTILRGNLLQRMGEPEAARAVYDTYENGNPGTTFLDPAYASLKADRTPPPEIATAADGAAEGLFGLASSLGRQNASETALLFGREALYLRPNFPAAQILVAGLLEADDRLEAANTVYAAIDRTSPFSPAARIKVASNLDRMDRTDEAVAELEALARAYPERTDALAEMGDILRRRERFTEAVKAYDRVFERIPVLEKQHWSLLYSRGMSLERSKDWPRAEADFLKALAFEPDQPYVLNYLGYSWVEKGKNLDQAQAMIKRAVSLRPNDGYIVDSLGWVYYRLGMVDEAVKELERAVELRPQDPTINDHLGDAYWRVGRRLEARFQWQRALTLDPEPDLVAEIRRKVQGGAPVVPVPPTANSAAAN